MRYISSLLRMCNGFRKKNVCLHRGPHLVPAPTNIICSGHSRKTRLIDFRLRNKKKRPSIFSNYSSPYGHFIIRIILVIFTANIKCSRSTVLYTERCNVAFLCLHKHSINLISCLQFLFSVLYYRLPYSKLNALVFLSWKLSGSVWLLSHFFSAMSPPEMLASCFVCELEQIPGMFAHLQSALLRRCRNLVSMVEARQSADYIFYS